MHLILASGSEGRKQLLFLLKIPFTVYPSGVGEETIHGKNPLETIQLRAQAKADDVVGQISLSKNIKAHHDLKVDQKYLVIAADSSVIFKNKLIGKPKNNDQAKHMLRELSGHTHEFTTAMCIKLIQKKSGRASWSIIKQWDSLDKGLVTMRTLSSEEIDRYLHLADARKYAGAYTLWQSPQDFITRVAGSLSSIIGLPLEKLIPILAELGIVWNLS